MRQPDDAMREPALEALNDKHAAKARADAARALGDAMRDAGHALWHLGYFVGSDRAPGRSSGGFGSDLTVGIATGLQVGAELIAGAAALLDLGNRYAAMALVRQLVEVEYLAWAFAEDRDRTAETWLRSTADDRRRLWQPRHLRESSGGRFRAKDYGDHCERGGHPTPSAAKLLPDHSDALPQGFIWLELCVHGSSTWDYFEAGIKTQQEYETIAKLPSVMALTESLESWRSTDHLIDLLAKLRADSS
ncbi:hypothetical protein AB6813_14360 [bacterium RCC_150]